MFCFNSLGDCGRAGTRAPTSGSQKPSLSPTANLALPRETGNPCFPHQECWSSFMKATVGTLGGGGQKMAQTPPWPSSSISIPGPPTWALVTRSPLRHTQALTCPGPRFGASQAALPVCFEQRRLFSLGCTAGRCLSVLSLSPHPSCLCSQPVILGGKVF